MDWRETLARAQADPLPRPTLDEVVAGIWTGATVTDVAPLPGGLGSVLHRIDLAGAPVPSLVLRQLLREFGDDEATLRREVGVHDAAAATSLPVPTVHWHDQDGDVLGRPALLLDLVPGGTLVADLVTDVGRRAMATVLHAVPEVPVAAVADLPRLDSIEAIVVLHWPPPAHSDVVDAGALGAAVRADAHAFDAGGRLVHMDLHAGNVLWDGERVTGVLDWPGAAIGNPLFDEAYCWFDTCLAHGRDVGDALQTVVDEIRPGPSPTPEERHLWRGLALQRGLPSPGAWTEAYVATGVDVDEATVEARFVALVEDHLTKD